MGTFQGSQMCSTYLLLFVQQTALGQETAKETGLEITKTKIAFPPLQLLTSLCNIPPPVLSFWADDNKEKTPG